MPFFSNLNFSLNWLLPIYLLGFMGLIFIAIFLYWRAGRHELYDSDFLLDLGFFSIAGGLICSRIFAFLVDFSTFDIDLYRLISFFRFREFSFLGFLFGLILFVFLFLRKRKENVWDILDFSVPAIVFAQALYYFLNFIIGKGASLSYLIYAFFYILFFIILKRLSTRKRHIGFFASIFLITTGVVYTLTLTAGEQFKIDDWETILRFLGSFAFILFGAVNWYLLSKRKFRSDIKNLFAAMLLGVFKFKKTITSLDEAGNFSKNLILFPYFILQIILVSLKGLMREVNRSGREFLYILGLKKF